MTVRNVTYLIVFILRQRSLWRHLGMLAGQVIIQILVVINGQNRLAETASLRSILQGADTKAIAEDQFFIERGYMFCQYLSTRKR